MHHFIEFLYTPLPYRKHLHPNNKYSSQPPVPKHSPLIHNRPTSPYVPRLPPTPSLIKKQRQKSFSPTLPTSFPHKKAKSKIFPHSFLKNRSPFKHPPSPRTSPTTSTHRLSAAETVPHRKQGIKRRF